jgi:hypothetical protein
MVRADIGQGWGWRGPGYYMYNITRQNGRGIATTNIRGEDKKGISKMGFRYF